MTKDEALKLALEALEHEAKVGNDNAYFTERQAIREALAQQQEPVAWMCSNKKLIDKVYLMFTITKGGDWDIPVYTYPPSKPLVNPSIKEYEDIMLANITPRTNDERDGIMGALNDMVVLLQEKNT